MDMTFAANPAQSPWELFQLQNLGLHTSAMLKDVHGQLVMVWIIVAALVRHFTTKTPFKQRQLMAKFPMLIGNYSSFLHVSSSN